MKNIFIIVIFFLSFGLDAFTQESILIEAENFKDKGGWVVDQQFMDLMGSPYLLAHGMGEKVGDATTTFQCDNSDIYYVYVRTFNWTSPWFNGYGPGSFKVVINKNELAKTGNRGKEWMWDYVGKTKIKKGLNTIALKDLTGFDGRCDAIFLTKNNNLIISLDINDLALLRKKYSTSDKSAKEYKDYDLTVIGGGIAGISAAVSAARLGLKVALINDRPILGGNNSSEIRVHLGGRIDLAPYPKLGELQKEFGHTRVGNAKPADYYEDYKKDFIIKNEKNITLFNNMRAIQVETENNKIKNVICENIENGGRIIFKSPLFVDCTGDGTIGYLAGADYMVGRESKDDFNESLAPLKRDKLTMGSSVQWYSKDENKVSNFPLFKYGVEFTKNNCEDVTMGEWTWETGMNLDQIKDFERIRDYGLLVIYSNWSYLKNNNSKYKNKKLDWVAYIAGKRESRRLIGDYILKEQDITRYILHEDATASTSWSIDLHYPDPKNSINFKDNEFKSIAKHVNIYPYPIPYRCLYSRNILNLFMAGRDISVTHIALGTTRVMRTTGMMGEVVGMAAYLCKKHTVMPKYIYYKYLNELKELMKKGVGKHDGMINNQTFNLGGTLKTVPKIE